MPALKQFQIEGSDFLASHRRALLADEPGLGKCGQTIAALDKVKSKRALIVCPTIATWHWLNEIEKWSSGATDYQITTWQEAAERSFKAMAPFDLILDESHYAKNPTAKRTHGVWAKNGVAWEGKGRIWCLSGTPAPNNPAELWPMLRAFGATELDYSAWVERFCHVDPMGRIRGTKRRAVPELRQIIAPYVMRRTKDQVMPELGAIDVQDWLVPISDRWMTPEILAGQLDDQRILGLMHEFSDAQIWDALKARFNHLSALRRYLAVAKAPHVYDTIRFEIDAGITEKLVVYGYHRDALQMMYRQALKDGIAAELIDGATKAADRAKAVARFQQKSRVLFLNMVAGGIAIDLTCAHQGIVLEWDWVPAVNEQAIQRMHRHGQTKPITIRAAVAANTVDAVVANVVGRKTRDLFALWSKAA